MKVVVVEDEHLTALFLKETLEALACQVMGLFEDGSAVLDFVKESPVDLVIMDVELEGEINGIQAAVELRSRFDIPSVFITSHNDSNTIREAMLAEPLGYVIKPISASHVESIVGVVKGLLSKKRASVPQNSDAEATPLGDGYSYNYDSKNLFHNGVPIDLTASELKLFDLCLRRHGNIVPHSVIDEYVWEGKVVTDSTRRGLFHRLRGKLNNRLFETVIGIGCRITLP
jgi:DNA-binding response OmpR family regulator